MEIPVAVFGQKIVMQANQRRLAPGSQKFIKFAFDLSEDWDGLTAFAQFKQGSNTYNVYLDNSNCVYMPAEISAGECYMMLYGTGQNSSIGTTNSIKLCINDETFVADSNSTVITESLYNQLVDQLDNYLTDDWIATLEEVKEALGI